MEIGRLAESLAEKQDALREAVMAMQKKRPGRPISGTLTLIISDSGAVTVSIKTAYKRKSRKKAVALIGQKDLFETLEVS